VAALAQASGDATSAEESLESLALAPKALTAKEESDLAWRANIEPLCRELLARDKAFEAVRWVAASSSLEFERAVRCVVGAGDRVLEIGSFGSSTEAAASIAAAVVLVEVRRSDSKSVAARACDAARRRACAGVEVRAVERLGGWRGAIHDGEAFDVVVVQDSLMGMDLVLDAFALLSEMSRRRASYAARRTGSKSGTGKRAASEARAVVKSAKLASVGARLFDARRVARGCGAFETALADGEARRRAGDADACREHECVFVAGVGVEEYRSVVARCVRAGDAVLEVGCHMGTTTALLEDAVGASGLCLGVDIGPKIVKRAQREHPRVAFRVGDAWATAGLRRLCARPGGWDVIFIDVGGLSGGDGVLEALALLRSCSAALEPRVIVIKSACLRALSASLTPFAALHREAAERRDTSA